MRVLIGDHLRRWKRRASEAVRRARRGLRGYSGDVRLFVSDVRGYVASSTDYVRGVWADVRPELRKRYVKAKVRIWNLWVEHPSVNGFMVNLGSLAAYVLIYGAVLNFTAAWFGDFLWSVSVPMTAESVAAFGALWYLMMEDVPEKLAYILRAKSDG